MSLCMYLSFWRMTDAIFNKLLVFYNKTVLKHKMFLPLEFAFMKEAGPKDWQDLQLSFPAPKEGTKLWFADRVKQELVKLQ